VLSTVFAPLILLTEIFALLCNRPSPNAAIFITLIVKVPVIQILTMMIALSMVALEFPMPQLKQTMIHRSIVLRIVMLVLQAFMAILFYQVCKMTISETTILINHAE
jgi:hypothetical protein